MTVLIVAAHPDDEVLGCGGTIARLADNGEDVYVAILGEGITARFDSRDHASDAAVSALAEKARRAASILNAQPPTFFDFPDNRFDSVPLLDIVKAVEKVIKKIVPHTIFTHHGGDLNIDHSLTFRAVLTATRPLAGYSVKEIFAFEVPSSTEWAFGRFGSFQPNAFFDITETLDKKINALQIYDSETRPFPHPRSPEALRALAASRGSIAGLAAAEAFEVVRLITGEAFRG